MTGSHNKNNNLILCIYQDTRTVFRLIDIAQLTGESNLVSLSKKLNYYVRVGKLSNLRKGIYAKKNYNTKELAGKIFTPSYISLEYVLQKAGVIFQYSREITSVSYLRREVEINSHLFSFRKVKGEILVNTSGVLQQQNYINMATPERAFLDMLYLAPDFYFDNLNPLKFAIINNLLSVYQSKALSRRVKKLLQNG